MRPETHAATARMRRHWWYRGRKAAVGSLLRRGRVPVGDAVLDFGCGTGHMGLVLARYGTVVGVDSASDALAQGSHASYAELCVVSEDALDEVPSGPFELIACLDVLEHVEDDAGLLGALYDRLAPGGHLLLSVPMGPELFGPHDEASGHKRRYSREGLDTLVETTELRSRARTGYVVAMLPLARMRRRGQDGTGTEDLRVPVAPLNLVLSVISLAEGLLCRFVALPPGLSEMRLLQKEGASGRDG